jgi:hypothetical protein
MNTPVAGDDGGIAGAGARMKVDRSLHRPETIEIPRRAKIWGRNSVLQDQ